MHEVSKNIFFLPLYLFMWVHIKDTIVLKVDILCGKKWKSCRHSQPCLVCVCHCGNRTTRKTARQTETKRTALSQAQISRRRPGSTGSRTLAPVRHNASQWHPNIMWMSLWILNTATWALTNSSPCWPQIRITGWLSDKRGSSNTWTQWRVWATHRWLNDDFCRYRTTKIV